MHLLFYKAPGHIWDKLVRIITGSKYSHVELSYEVKGTQHRCWSSCTRSDGTIGVREKWQETNTDHWDIIELKGTYTEALFTQEKDRGYDFIGLICTVIHTKIFNSAHKWFCSEIVAEVLGLKDSWKYSPETLYRLYK